MGAQTQDGPVPGSVRRAVEHMRADLARPLRGSDLARAAGVPDRTLRAHFRRFFGVSPFDWLQQSRLSAVREALLAPGPGETVATAATRFGMSHLPRFAAQYCRRFGESPSTTLARGRADARRPGPPMILRGPTIVVLPFVCEDGVAGSDVRDLVDALAERLAAELGRMRSGPVRLARRTDAAGAGDARYGLAGRAMRAGDRLRVMLRLFDAQDGTQLWGDAFDGTASDPLALQDRALQAALRAVTTKVDEAETDKAWSKSPDSLMARDLVTRAVPLIRLGDPDSTERALDLLARAMELDAGDAAVHGLAAACHAQRVSNGSSRDWTRDRTAAQQFGGRSAALDPSDPLALVARSIVALHTGDRIGVDELTARALAIRPGLAWAWERRGYLHVLTGEFDAGFRHYAQAMRLSGPRTPVVACLTGMAQAHLWRGRAEPAAAVALRAIALNPRAIGPQWVLPPIYALLGEDSEARRAVDRLRRLTPEVSLSWFASSMPALAWSATRRDFLARIQDRMVGLGMPR
jgi:TolB-like protein